MDNKKITFTKGDLITPEKFEQNMQYSSFDYYKCELCHINSHCSYITSFEYIKRSFIFKIFGCAKKFKKIGYYVCHLCMIENRSDIKIILEKLNNMVDITKLRIGNYILHGENKDEAVLIKITPVIFNDIANNPSLYFHAPITEEFLFSREFYIYRNLLGKKIGYAYNGKFGRRCREILLLDYPPYFFLFINFNGKFYPKKKDGLENTYIPIYYIDRLQNAFLIISGGQELD